MNFLREYVRALLSEDLGRQVWATRANADSRHYGTERDTDREAELWDALYRYLIADYGAAVSEADVQDIRKYMKDPRYNDVFVPYNWDDHLYRGIILPRDYIESRLKVPLGELSFPLSDRREFSEPIPVDFTYTPKEFYRKGLVSSWTAKKGVAEQYAREGDAPWGDESVMVILTTDTTRGDFIDIEPMIFLMSMIML